LKEDVIVLMIFLVLVSIVIMVISLNRLLISSDVFKGFDILTVRTYISPEKMIEHRTTATPASRNRRGNHSLILRLVKN